MVSSRKPESKAAPLLRTASTDPARASRSDDFTSDPLLFLTHLGRQGDLAEYRTPYGPVYLLNRPEYIRHFFQSGKYGRGSTLIDPTHREGFADAGGSASPPPSFSRARALRWFLLSRLRLYRDELRPLDAAARIKYFTGKLHSLRSLIEIRNAVKDTRREIRLIEVIQANIRALDRYCRKPLSGKLRAVEIFESAHARNSTGESFDWKPLWGGRIITHPVPGKDSGDVLQGDNGRILARLLGERFRAALGGNTAEGAPDGR